MATLLDRDHMKIKIQVALNPEHGELPKPTYETAGAAGFDIRADVPPGVGQTIAPGSVGLVATGLRVAVPMGYELQVRPRSGIALKQGVTVMNSPGTVDADYRGPVGVILFNSTDTPFHISHGDRIAQGVICPVVQGDFDLVDELPSTDRGEGGFGSTGVK